MFHHSKRYHSKELKYKKSDNYAQNQYTSKKKKKIKQ